MRKVIIIIMFLFVCGITFVATNPDKVNSWKEQAKEEASEYAQKESKKYEQKIITTLERNLKW